MTCGITGRPGWGAEDKGAGAVLRVAAGTGIQRLCDDAETACQGGANCCKTPMNMTAPGSQKPRKVLVSAPLRDGRSTPTPFRPK